MRDEDVTSQRTKNLEEVGRAGTGVHSQVLPAHLQTTARGVQVYFGGHECGAEGPFPHQQRSIPVTRQMELGYRCWGPQPLFSCPGSGEAKLEGGCPSLWGD